MEQMLAKLPIDGGLLVDLRDLIDPWLQEDFVDPLDGQAAAQMLARLPRVDRGARLHINLAKYHPVSEPGQCSAWSLTLDLNDTEITCSECSTFLTDLGSSDSAADVIFTCNIHGHEEGDLTDWLIVLQDVSSPAVTVKLDLADDMYGLDWDISDFELASASPAVKKALGYKEPPPSAADLLRPLIMAFNETARLKRVSERQSKEMYSLAILASVFAALAAALAPSPLWMLPAIIGASFLILGAGSSSHAGGLGIALLEIELGARRAGFKVDRQGEAEKVDLQWPVLDAALKAAFQLESSRIGVTPGPSRRS